MSYYSKEYPEKGDIVYTTISRIENDALYCKLIEYENKEGFLPITGLDKKSQSNPKKYFKENKIYPMTVMDIDADTGTIDLNYNRIKSDDRDKYLEKFDYCAKIFRFTHEISMLTDLFMDSILPKTMWKVLQKEDIDNSKEIYTSILDDPAKYIKEIMIDNPEMEKKTLDNIESRIVKTHMSIHQEFYLNITCNNAVNVLKKILNYQNDDAKIEYVNAPKYRIIVEGKTDDECDTKLKACINYLKTAASEWTGVMFSIGSRIVAREKEIFIKHLANNANIK